MIIYFSGTGNSHYIAQKIADETQDKKPVWENNCTHCMACINYCPTQAIESFFQVLS